MSRYRDLKWLNDYSYVFNFLHILMFKHIFLSQNRVSKPWLASKGLKDVVTAAVLYPLKSIFSAKNKTGEIYNLFDPNYTDKHNHSCFKYDLFAGYITLIAYEMGVQHQDWQ